MSSLSSTAVVDDIPADRACFDGMLLACVAFGKEQLVKSLESLATDLLFRCSYDTVHSTHSSTSRTSKADWSCLLGPRHLLECAVSGGDSGYHRQN